MSLGDYSYEAMKSAQKDWIEEIHTLKKIPYDQLDSKRKQTYDVLLNYFRRKLDFSDLCLCAQDLSPTIGIQSQLPVLFSEYRFTSKTDLDNYLTLLRSVTGYFDGLCRFQEEKAKHHSFMNKEACLKVISQCKDFLNNKTLSSNILSTSFTNRLNHCSFLTEQERKKYIQKNHRILMNSVFPSYEKLIATLSALISKGSCDHINGLCSIKNGKDYYEYLVRDNTGCSLSVPEIKAMIQQALLQDVQSLQQLLQQHPNLEQHTPSKNLKEPDAIIKDLEQKMAEDFPSSNTLTYEFKTVDKNLQDYLSPAFYITPPLDNPQNNVIYINPQKTEDLYTVLAHEGLPGHMYQNAVFASTHPDPIRYLTECGGYMEGWAVYAELLSYQYQYSDTTVATALQLNTTFSLALYCLCDLGVNYEGWSLFDLQHFLRTYNVTDSTVCKNIFQAVIEDPTNYLKYYVGYLQIIALRDVLKKTQGTNFRLKDFHQTLLIFGPADFDTLNKWMPILMAS
jgi:uncharacterized protein (DUF885 family)